jgi:hypothetical protein
MQSQLFRLSCILECSADFHNYISPTVHHRLSMHNRRPSDQPGDRPACEGDDCEGRNEYGAPRLPRETCKHCKTPCVQATCCEEPLSSSVDCISPNSRTKEARSKPHKMHCVLTWPVVTELGTFASKFQDTPAS